MESYSTLMNSALRKLLSAFETWRNEDQETPAEAAHEIEALRTGVYTLSTAEEVAVAEGLQQADRGQFVDDARIRALWKRAGL
jgi:hypothetical protein